MRVVLDTNIFVGACLGRGVANAVLSACLEQRFVPLMGTALFNEHEAVLSRTELFAHCRLSATERDTLLDIYLARCEWIRIYYTWRPNLPDEADNHVMELAVAGDASVLVSRNRRDFDAAQLRFPQIRVHTPEDFLKEL